MLKITRLVKGELNKMLLNPLIYVVVGILVVSLLITFIAFGVADKQKALNAYSQCTTNQAVVQLFYSTEKDFGKSASDLKLVNTQNMLNYYEEVANNQNVNSAKKLNDDFLNIKNSFRVLKEKLVDGKASFDNIKATSAAECVNSMLSIANQLSVDYTQLTNKNLPLAFTTKEHYNSFNNSIIFAVKTLSTDEHGNVHTYTEASSFDAFNHITTSFDAQSTLQKLDLALKNLEDVSLKIGATDIAKIQLTANLGFDYIQTLEDEIAISGSSGAYAIADVIKKCENYDLVSSEIESYVQNSIYSLLFSGISESKINSYNNFENSNIYLINQEKNLNEYLLNQTPILTPLNYNSAYSNTISSSNEVSAFDFTYFGLNIAIIFVIIICVIFGSMIISKERETGTLKCLMAHPISRNQLVTAKILATITLGVITFLAIALLTFISGAIVFGVNANPILFTFNASHIVLMSPWVYFLIFLLCSFIKIAFYSIMDVAVSSLLKQSRITLSISLVLCVLILMCNVYLPTSSILSYLTPANITHKN